MFIDIFHSNCNSNVGSSFALFTEAVNLIWSLSSIPLKHINIIFYKEIFSLLVLQRDQRSASTTLPELVANEWLVQGHLNTVCHNIQENKWSSCVLRNFRCCCLKLNSACDYRVHTPALRVWKMKRTNYCLRVLEQHTEVSKQLEWSSSEAWAAPRFTAPHWGRASAFRPKENATKHVLQSPAQQRQEKRRNLAVQMCIRPTVDTMWCQVHVVDSCDWLTGYIHLQWLAGQGTARV